MYKYKYKYMCCNLEQKFISLKKVNAIELVPLRLLEFPVEIVQPVSGGMHESFMMIEGPWDNDLL